MELSPLPFDYPGMSQPARRALQHAGYRTLGQLSKATEKQLLALHGFGPKGLRVIKAELKAQGKSLAK